MLFLGFVLAPGFIHLFEAEHDLIVFIDAGEEEEKSTESVEDIEFRLAETSIKNDLSIIDREKFASEHEQQINSILFAEIICPPPEMNLL